MVESLKVITYDKSLRTARYAFEFAYLNHRRKVSAIHKANIMKQGDGLFLKVGILCHGCPGISLPYLQRGRSCCHVSGGKPHLGKCLFKGRGPTNAACRASLVTGRFLHTARTRAPDNAPSLARALRVHQVVRAQAPGGWPPSNALSHPHPAATHVCARRRAARWPRSSPAWLTRR